MSSIFERLQFPSYLSSSTIALSDSTTKTMNTMPPLLSEWQYNDLASSNVNGYYENKLVGNINNLISINNQIASNTSYNSSLPAIYSATQSLSATLTHFKSHTDRLSGVEPVNASTVDLPHYETAIGMGKMLTQLVYQNDGVANNAVMIGSLGSLFQQNTLISEYETLSPYPQLIKAHEVVTTVVDPDTGGSTTTYTSNLTSQQISTITSNILAANTQLNTFINSDVAFFLNSRTVSSDFHALRAFSNTGQTENDLLQNYVGSDKLLQRLN